MRPIVAGALALATAMGIGRFAYTAILPTMERSASLSTPHAGILASVNYLGYLLGALLAAAVPRGGQQRIAAIVCLALVPVTTALMAVTTDLGLWSVIRLVSGLASAGVFVLVNGLVLDYLRHRGRAALAGWVFGGVGVGIAASGLTVQTEAGALGWRGTWVLLALLAGIAALVASLWLPSLHEPSPIPPSGPSNPEDGRVGLTLGLLVSAYFLEGAGYIVTGTFLVAIVDRMHGLSAAGPTIWTIAGLAAIPSVVLWTRLAADHGPPQALIAAYLAQAVGIMLPAFASGFPVAVVAAALFGGTFIGISALTITLAGVLVPHRSAAAIGILTAIFGVGQIIGPSLAAYLTSVSHSFTLALIAAAAMVFCGAALIAILLARPLQTGGESSPGFP